MTVEYELDSLSLLSQTQSDSGKIFFFLELWPNAKMSKLVKLALFFSKLTQP